MSKCKIYKKDILIERCIIRRDNEGCTVHCFNYKGDKMEEKEMSESKVVKIMSMSAVGVAVVLLILCVLYVGTMFKLFNL